MGSGAQHSTRHPGEHRERRGCSDTETNAHNQRVSAVIRAKCKGTEWEGGIPQGPSARLLGRGRIPSSPEPPKRGPLEPPTRTSPGLSWLHPSKMTHPRGLRPAEAVATHRFFLQPTKGPSPGLSPASLCPHPVTMQLRPQRLSSSPRDLLSPANRPVTSHCSPHPALAWVEGSLTSPKAMQPSPGCRLQAGPSPAGQWPLEKSLHCQF